MADCHICRLPTELLHDILALLPTKDLLFLQRVNRQWQATVKDSLDFQQKLFLKPREFQKYWYQTLQHSPTIISSAWGNVIAGMNNISANRPDEVEEACFVSSDLNRTKLRGVGELNGLVIDYVLEGNIFHKILRDTKTTVFLYDGLAIADRHFASWGKMYITQPPIKSVEFYEWPFSRPRRPEDTPSFAFEGSDLHAVYLGGEITNQSGITMLDIVEKAIELENETNARFLLEHACLKFLPLRPTAWQEWCFYKYKDEANEAGCAVGRKPRRFKNRELDPPRVG